MPGEPTTEESGQGWDMLEAGSVSHRAGLPEPSNGLEGDTGCDGVGTALQNRGCWSSPLNSLQLAL